MARKLPEWVGASPDSAVPPRVKLRLFEEAEGRCAECTRLLWPGDKWEADHTIAIINGGENRETNLQVLCDDPCHTDKTANDVAEKATVSRVRTKHVGVRKKPSGRGFATNRSGKWKKCMDGTVVRRDD